MTTIWTTCPRLAQAVLALALFACGGEQEGGGGRRSIATADTTGPAPASSFVPVGFRVESSVRAQLDGSGGRELALVLRRAGKSPSEADRRLVVLGAVGTGYRRAAEGRRILLCSSCGGALYGVLEAPVRLSANGATLVVRQSYGSREVTDQTFRLAMRGKGVRLIGYDEVVYDRATGGQWATRTNLITGERIRTRRLRAEARTVRTRFTLRISPIALSQVDLHRPLSR